MRQSFQVLLFFCSIVNASLVPGDFQKENTDEVLQDEHLSDGDNARPENLPGSPNHPLGHQETDVWEDLDRNRNQICSPVWKVGECVPSTALFIDTNFLLGFISCCPLLLDGNRRGA